MTDQELYKKCQDCGGNARKWMREFAYYLPEVARRDLHRRRGFQSIYEFAAKLSGMSFEVCNRVLQLNNKFEHMPRMWEQIRTHGWSKLRVIAFVVNRENEKIWIENMNRCTKSGLEKLVKKFKSVPGERPKKSDIPLTKSTTQSTLTLGDKVPCGDRAIEDDRTLLKFKVDEETEFQFKKFKHELEKKNGKAMTMGEVLKELLQKAETPKPKTRKTKKITKITRYIPVQRKRETEQRQNDRCRAENCNELATEFHHPERFFLNRSHKELVKLCRSHHQLAHAGLIDERDEWQVNWQARKRDKRVEEVDEKVRQARRRL